MNKTVRDLLVVVTTCATVFGLGLLGAAPVASDTVTDPLAATQTTTDTTTRPTTRDCVEEDACWNSCTMGNLNPCDLTSVLPNGARFRVELDPMPATHAYLCDTGALVHVAVSAVATDDTVSAVADESVCAAGDADLGATIVTVLPGLYREAAAQLDAQ